MEFITVLQVYAYLVGITSGMLLWHLAVRHVSGYAVDELREALAREQAERADLQVKFDRLEEEALERWVLLQNVQPTRVQAESVEKSLRGTPFAHVGTDFLRSHFAWRPE